MKKKLFELFAILMLLVCTLGTVPNVNTFAITNEITLTDANSIILESGMPMSVLNDLEEDVRIKLAQGIIDNGGEYVGSSTSYYCVNEDGSLQQVLETKSNVISDSDLKLTSTLYNWGSNTYKLIGGYEWLTRKQNISNHNFSMAVNQSANIIPSSISYSKYRKETSSSSWVTIASGDTNYYDADDSGKPCVVWGDLGRGTYLTGYYYKGTCEYNISNIGSKTGTLKVQYAAGDVTIALGGYGIVVNSTNTQQATKLYSYWVE